MDYKLDDGGKSVLNFLCVNYVIGLYGSQKTQPEYLGVKCHDVCFAFDFQTTQGNKIIYRERENKHGKILIVNLGKRYVCVHCTVFFKVTVLLVFNSHM